MITPKFIAPVLGLLPNVTLNCSETALLCERIESVMLKEDDYFIQQGMPVHQIGFVMKGFLRKYNFNQKGERIIRQLIFPNLFFTDRDGYYKHLPSGTNIQAITPCHLLTIQINEVERLRELSPKFETLIRQLTEITVYERSKIECLIWQGDAKERYHYFNSLFPNWEKYIPASDVWCYLHMTHSTFCYIRK